MTRRFVVGAAAVALVVLAARSLAYAVEPGASARFLSHRAGGPALPFVALATLALALALAVGICWLAAPAVRERALIERREPQSFAVARTLALAAALTVASSLAGGLLEAYIHWRAGLGWHGLHCVLGPVHRDLLPFEAGLSTLAAAFIAACVHVARWLRRTFARLAAQLPVLPHVCVPRRVATQAALLPVRLCAGLARAPPALG